MAEKTFFNISKIFNIVPRPIFCADSKSGFRFFVQPILSSSFEKRSENDLTNNLGT